MKFISTFLSLSLILQQSEAYSYVSVYLNYLLLVFLIFNVFIYFSEVSVMGISGLIKIIQDFLTELLGDMYEKLISNASTNPCIFKNPLFACDNGGRFKIKNIYDLCDYKFVNIDNRFYDTALRLNETKKINYNINVHSCEIIYKEETDFNSFKVIKYADNFYVLNNKEVFFIGSLELDIFNKFVVNNNYYMMIKRKDLFNAGIIHKLNSMEKICYLISNDWKINEIIIEHKEEKFDLIDILKKNANKLYLNILFCLINYFIYLFLLKISNLISYLTIMIHPIMNNTQNENLISSMFPYLPMINNCYVIGLNIDLININEDTQIYDKISIYC